MPGTDDSCQTFLGSEFSRGNALFSKLFFFCLSKLNFLHLLGKITLFRECGQNNNNKMCWSKHHITEEFDDGIRTMRGIEKGYF